MRRVSSSFGRFNIYCGILLTLSLGIVGCFPEGYHAGFLASWSRDGSRAALVPNFLDDGERESGVWIFDAATKRTEQIVSFRDGRYCLQPQWSPFGEELLFAVIEKDGDGWKGEGRTIAFTAWIVGSDGSMLRKVAASSGHEESLFLPNAVAWGATPGSILLQTTIGDEVTALRLDLVTGQTEPFLPANANLYSLQPSPSREQVAALLYNPGESKADLYLAGFAAGSWRQVETLHYDPSRLDLLPPMIYWSPDSTHFVIPESGPGSRRKPPSEHFLRLFDARSGASWRLGEGNPGSGIFWNADGSAVFFSSRKEDSIDSTRGIYRADLRAPSIVRVVSSGENHLLSCNSEDGRIYFYRVYRTTRVRGTEADEIPLQKFFSCAPDGSDLRELNPSYLTGKSGWSLSPDGTQVMFVSDAPTLSAIDFRTGHAQPLLLTDWQKMRMLDHLLASNQARDAARMLEAISPEKGETRPGAYFARGCVVATRMGDPAAAERAWRALIARLMQDWDRETLEEAALVFEEQNETSRLRQLCETALTRLSLPSERAEIHGMIAESYRMEGNEGAAVSKLQEMVEEFPDLPVAGEALSSMAEIFEKSRDYLRAAQIAGRLADRAATPGERATHLLAKGRYLKGLGDVSGAEGAFREILRLQPLTTASYPAADAWMELLRLRGPVF